MGVSRSTAIFERLPSPKPAVLTQSNFTPELSAKHVVQTPELGKPFFKRQSEPAHVAPTEVSFGPFRLFPKQFLLLEDDTPVPLGSRALEILIALLERPGELISKEDLRARVWPNVFVEPANLTVQMSALRRTLRDGRDGNRFIIGIRGSGYRFVAPVQPTPQQKASVETMRRIAPEPEEHRQIQAPSDRGAGSVLAFPTSRAAAVERSYS